MESTLAARPLNLGSGIKTALLASRYRAENTRVYTTVLRITQQINRSRINLNNGKKN